MLLREIFGNVGFLVLLGWIYVPASPCSSKSFAIDEIPNRAIVNFKHFYWLELLEFTSRFVGFVCGLECT